MRLGPRYGMVSRRIWGDARFRSLSAPQPNARDLWLYLLTCQGASGIPGVVLVRIEVAAGDLGWPMRSVLEVFKELETKEMAFADWHSGIVWMPKAMRHDPPGSPNHVKGWISRWAEIPDSHLLLRIRNGIVAELKRFNVAFSKMFANAIPEPMPMAPPNPSELLLLLLPLPRPLAEGPEAAAAQRGSGAPEPCPRDLDLTPDQRANVLMTKGVSDQAINAIRDRFVTSYLGKPGEHRTLDQWRSGLSKAVCNDAVAEERRIRSEAETGGEKSGVRPAEDEAIKKASDENLRKIGIDPDHVDDYRRGVRA